jgi:hypothetical protein
VSSLKLSDMEVAVLRAFHEAYRDVGFPQPEAIAVERRQNTGAGRYLDLDSMAELGIDDGYLDLPDRYIRMSGVPNGLMATVAVEGGKLRQLEFAVFGDDSWDGEERTWAIV